MTCDAERDAFWDAMKALSKAMNNVLREQQRLKILKTRFENVCGYYQGNGEYAFDPLEPGDPDFPEGGPTCSEAFSDWLDQFIDWIAAQRLVVDLEKERRDRWHEFSKCMHQEKH